MEKGNGTAVQTIVKKNMACFTCFLGFIHGDVCVAQDLFSSIVVIFAPGNACADGSEKIKVIQFDRTAYLFMNTLSQDEDAIEVGDVLK